jgi:poly-gamma-glutamate capsule biosynthesis protein CapA/YwtB (metallophosphatase superfamily)
MTADRLTLALVGDVNCKADAGCEPALAPSVRDELAHADVCIGNLEGAFADPSVELHYKRGWFHCEPEMLRVVAPHFDAFACANNVHYGAAIETSIRHLDRAGIPHTGAGATLAEAQRPAILERDGTRIGLLAFTSVFWPDGHAATESQPGVATIRAATAYEPHWRVHEMPGGPATVRTIADVDELAAALDAIRRLRAEVDVVVVHFHWGVSLSEEVAEYQRHVGRAAIEAGADVVVGSHPHVVQGVELWMDRPIFYSLGNFMFGWRLHREATRDGVLVHLETGGARPWRCRAVPVRRNDRNEVEALALDTPHGARIAGRLAELSAQFGTELVPDGSDGLVVQAERATATAA